ncbi:MAG: HEAT repeat domain-containing protein [Nitrospirae bacterium]|nr:HEAT repeat domain-containing protein [Nitrospirota bacterium]
MVQEAQTEHKASGVLGGIAKFLNTSGKLMVKTYDLTADLVGKTTEAAGKAAASVTSASPQVFGKAKDILAGGFGKFFRSNEKLELRTKVNEYEEKIKKLYFEIGKEGSSAEKLESEKVTELIGKVRDYEQEINRLQVRITEMNEMDALRREEAKKEKVKPAARKSKVSDEQVEAVVRAAIDKAVKHGEFDSDSQREIFKKIATDLLDEEMEVRILAAAELGKMGIKPTVDILIEAVKFDNVYLTVEILNSLTNIGDARTLSLCKEMAKSPNHRVRISSLRGLYKMGADVEIASYLIEALNDEHPEVRRTATTFLGWKDIADSIPGLIQTLQDKDESVRKSAVTALMNIKDTSSVLPLMRVLSDANVDIRQKALEALRAIIGEEISFDVRLKGRELSDAVNVLKEWWQSERIGKIEDTPEAASSMEEEAVTVKAGRHDVETSPEAVMLKEEELKKKLKSDLIDLCRSRGVGCDETFTKAELIAMLLSKQ